MTKFCFQIENEVDNTTLRENPEILNMVQYSDYSGLETINSNWNKDRKRLIGQLGEKRNFMKWNKEP